MTAPNSLLALLALHGQQQGGGEPGMPNPMGGAMPGGLMPRPNPGMRPPMPASPLNPGGPGGMNSNQEKLRALALMRLKMMGGGGGGGGNQLPVQRPY